MTPLEHHHDHAVGGADRKEVHDDRLQRHENRAEDGHEQEEAQEEHDADEERETFADEVGEIDTAGREPADIGGDSGAGHHGRDDLVTQRVDERGRRFVLWRRRRLQEDHRGGAVIALYRTDN